MVYSCPETVSDMYVNLCEWLPRGRGGRGGEGGRRGGRGSARGETEYKGRSLQKCQAMVHFSRQLK